jgi:transcription initiation factor TFIIIB Brf1 subunit/transcription initiation factor TFIIB
MKLQELKIEGFTTGQSVCAHCGTGIKNLVLVRDADGVKHHIGTDCATRIGLDAQQIRNKITDDQRAEITRKVNEHMQRQDERLQEHREWLKRRQAEVKEVSTALRDLGGEFYCSLAGQIEAGTLSSKQAYYVAVALLRRKTKKNEDQWWDMIWICTHSEV